MKVSTPRAALVFACLAIVPVCEGASLEPKHQGKTLGQWIELHEQAPAGSEQELQAADAIRKIGTNAVPILTQWVSDTASDYHLKAPNAFEILGPASAGAIPELDRLIHGTNELVTITAAMCLGKIGGPAAPALVNALTNGNYRISTAAALALPDLGTNAAPAIPYLLSELRHPNHLRRERAASTLGGISIQPEIVVPALTNLLSDSSLPARFLALDSLGSYDQRARAALPAILPFLTNSDRGLRWSATNAIKSIAPEMLSSSVK